MNQLVTDYSKLQKQLLSPEDKYLFYCGLPRKQAGCAGENEHEINIYPFFE
jgi:hypothetical protein